MEENKERKKVTISDLTVNQFMWRVVGWILLYGSIGYGLIFLLLYLVA